MFSRQKRRAGQAPVSHQTVRLARGKHWSPEQGACVMELASVLAGESFTDQPMCACPVIGSFLRAYNDSIDSERRQDLYVYASKVIGSRADEKVELARADRLARWAFELRQQHRMGLLRRFHERRRVRHTTATSSIGMHAVRAINRHTGHTHAAVLALVDELLEIGTQQRSNQMLAPEQTIVASG